VPFGLVVSADTLYAAHPSLGVDVRAFLCLRYFYFIFVCMCAYVCLLLVSSLLLPMYDLGFG